MNMAIKNQINSKYFILLLIILFHPSTTWAAPRYLITAQVTFSKQGSSEPFVIHNWGQEIVVPIDQATGQATGKRQHKPLVIRKPVDGLSPLLYQALATNEVLSNLTIRVFKGSKALLFTIKLTNARVIRAAKEANADNKIDTVDLEKFEFVYQTIEWTDAKSGAVSEDSWNEGPA